MPATLRPRFTNSGLSNEDAIRVLRFFWPDTPGDRLLACNLTPEDRCDARSLLVMGLNDTVAFLRGADNFGAVSPSDVNDRITVTNASAPIQDLLITSVREAWVPNASEHFRLNPNINDLIRRRLANNFLHLFSRIRGTGA